MSNILPKQGDITIHNQKRILVVCQKRAALDVVYQRLDKIGLSKYTALLHDPDKDRKSLYQQAERLLRSNSDIERLDYNIDSKLRYCSQQIDEIRTKQNSIITALVNQHFGIPIRQLYAIAKPGYIPRLNLDEIVEKIDYNVLEEMLYVIKSLEADCKKFDTPKYPWSNRKDFSSFDFNNKNKIELVLEENDIPNDTKYITSLRNRAKKGLQLWNSIHGLKPYLNDIRLDHIKSLLLSPEGTGMLSSLLFDRSNSVEDFSDLVNYDRKKIALSSKEDGLQNRWNFLLSNSATLLGQTNIQRQSFQFYL